MDQDIEDCVHHLIQIIQQPSWFSTTNPHKHSNQNCAPALKQKTLDKRWLRRRWQHTRSPQDKANLDKATNELKTLLNIYKQQAIQTYLESLTPTEATEHTQAYCYHSPRCVKCAGNHSTKHCPRFIGPHHQSRTIPTLLHITGTLLSGRWRL